MTGHTGISHPDSTDPGTIRVDGRLVFYKRSPTSSAPPASNGGQKLWGPGGGGLVSPYFMAPGVDDQPKDSLLGRAESPFDKLFGIPTGSIVDWHKQAIGKIGAKLFGGGLPPQQDSPDSDPNGIGAGGMSFGGGGIGASGTSAGGLSGFEPPIMQGVGNIQGVGLKDSQNGPFKGPETPNSPGNFQNGWLSQMLSKLHQKYTDFSARFGQFNFKPNADGDIQSQESRASAGSDPSSPSPSSSLPTTQPSANLMQQSSSGGGVQPSSRSSPFPSSSASTASAAAMAAYAKRNSTPSSQGAPQTPAQAVAARNPGPMPNVNLGMNITQNNDFKISCEKEVNDQIAEVRKRLMREFNVAHSETRLLAAMIDGCNVAELY